MSAAKAVVSSSRRKKMCASATSPAKLQSNQLHTQDATAAGIDLRVFPLKMLYIGGAEGACAAAVRTGNCMIVALMFVATVITLQAVDVVPVSRTDLPTLSGIW